jgi:lysophospholipase L1-like esterase
MNKVLIITDSLGSPRCTPEYCSDEHSWTYQLCDKFTERAYFRPIISPSLDSSQLKNKVSNYLKAYENVTIIVLQIGIVDCYPRALKKNELSLVIRLPSMLSKFIHKMVKRHYSFLVKHRNIQYVSVDEFRVNITEFKHEFPDAKFVVVPIAPASTTWERKNFRVGSAIKEYNEVLKDIFDDGLIDDCYPEDHKNDIFMSDQHHLNELGAKLVLDSVSKKIKPLLSK